MRAVLFGISHRSKNITIATTTDPVFGEGIARILFGRIGVMAHKADLQHYAMHFGAHQSKVSRFPNLTGVGRLRCAGFRRFFVSARLY